MVLLALLLAVLLAGCGADGAGATEEQAAGSQADQAPGAVAGPDAGAPAGEAAQDGAAGGAADDGGGSDGADGGAGADAAPDGAAGALPEPGAAAVGRRVVTSSIDVAVDDVPAAAEEVRALAVRAGGEVAAESSSGGQRPRAEIVLRVPADGTPGVMASVAALGSEVARTAESEPVETRLVDLESRTATQRVGVERIRSLLAGATTLEDVLALETELSRRQADLESVDAQRAALADLAALATVTVRLSTPEGVEAAGRDLPPFLDGLRGGWEALGASTSVVLVVLGAVLPFLVVLGVVLALVVAGVRLVRRGRPEAGSTP
ncbi:DUF4349 domain-containing protein [Aquipuribacter hungaricus]|uniref:DUF4349 domain-containing protein n=2 Tax=Aquipuribacter hungaricus TaxID=545624 RepID=A0ABV7WK76_9MICO